MKGLRVIFIRRRIRHLLIRLVISWARILFPKGWGRFPRSRCQGGWFMAPQGLSALLIRLPLLLVSQLLISWTRMRKTQRLRR